MVKRKFEASARRRGALRLQTRAEEAPVTTSDDLKNLPGDEEESDEEDFVEEDFDDGLDDEAIAAEHAEAEAEEEPEEDETEAAAEAEHFALAVGSEDPVDDLASDDDLLGDADERQKPARANHHSAPRGTKSRDPLLNVADVESVRAKVGAPDGSLDDLFRIQDRPIVMDTLNPTKRTSNQMAWRRRARCGGDDLRAQVG